MPVHPESLAGALLRQLTIAMALSLSSLPMAHAQPASRCTDSVRMDARERGPLMTALRRFGTQEDVAILRVCGLPRTYVSATWAKKRDSRRDFGPRIVVLTMPRGDSARIVFASAGLMDSFLPDLSVFRTGGRALLLADLGDEGSWGLATYEITTARVRERGLLNVGLPRDDGDPDISAASHIQLSRCGSKWYAHFDTVALHRPNQNPQFRGRPSSELALTPASAEWRVIPRSAIPAEC